MNIGMKKILLTGGTGSFGKAFIKETITKYQDVERLVIYSRDELKQWELQQIYPEKQYPQIRFFLGDVRDENRLRRALEGIDTVVHAAALKQVPAAEYNPFEFVKTNIIGANNLIQACLDTEVSNIVALSTDKAAAPINLYGATKLCSDKLFIAANNVRGGKNTKFSVVRYGNVMGSRGSVIPYFLKEAKNSGKLNITDTRMTRFNIVLKEGVEMVHWAIKQSMGGEIFVPKIPSYRIVDVAEAIAPSLNHEVIGIRPGEKIHEEMITTSDSTTTLDLGKYYAITPAGGGVIEKYKKEDRPYERVKEGFTYNSLDNKQYLNISEIRALIRSNIDHDFTPI
ncbi:capsular polysaccharide biosynthesis protein [Synechococcus sp. CC9902]|uniref:UDP-N-acetylglucosamine 4,6-dehydratase (inverting) n=1 Tax=Synechococcus sp. (strain CC9902) TaxID=316279 RepID=UPI00005D3CFE|nr:UDP-N-acetylglucosamine 4,6-dehydratase (inverting) [Synechococcus sp. CC9902]ABB25076.1 capsular polysaccharide biosynthesis protein [Synechococcus sp. CC9902]